MLCLNLLLESTNIMRVALFFLAFAFVSSDVFDHGWSWRCRYLAQNCRSRINLGNSTGKWLLVVPRVCTIYARSCTPDWDFVLEPFFFESDFEYDRNNTLHAKFFRRSGIAADFPTLRTVIKSQLLVVFDAMRIHGTGSNAIVMHFEYPFSLSN